MIDTSALLAVILGEPERDRIVELTTGNTLIGPGSIPWEVGNAFSAMLKQKRLTLDQAQGGFAILETVPIQYVMPDFLNAMKLAHEANIYAYDACFLDCAARYNAPLLTLDRKLKTAAEELGVATWEI
ncbi:MAG TPA: type II toxin-antitoxin system VapC family toxin [Sedimentisphaerales bacterium]|nr:type II toxin-antitoxin system VapC family toxin [Sedimentisphaerales bacterium]